MSTRTGTHRCKFSTYSTRCNASVSLVNAIRFPRGGRLPIYCKFHQTSELRKKTFALHSARGTRNLQFRSFVPQYLEHRTQVALRSLMFRTLPPSDGPGYVYALELQDTSRPDLIRIKVGRSIDVHVRLNQHRNRCRSSKPVLLGSFPVVSSSLRTSTVPYCDRRERLFHVELAELSAKSHPPSRGAPLTACPDCGKRHTEIFTFKRLQGKNRGREWSMIIRPVIERWARFVEYLV